MKFTKARPSDNPAAPLLMIELRTIPTSMHGHYSGFIEINGQNTNGVYQQAGMHCCWRACNHVCKTLVCNCSTLVCKRSSNTCSKRCCARRWVHSRIVTVRQSVFFPHLYDLYEHMKCRLAFSVPDRTCVQATCSFNATASVSAAFLIRMDVSNWRCSHPCRRSGSSAFAWPFQRFEERPVQRGTPAMDA